MYTNLITKTPFVVIYSPIPEVINTCYIHNSPNFIPSNKSILEILNFAFNQKLKFYIHRIFYLIITLISNMGENKIYDVSFKCPFNCIISGSSGSGKTNKILEFLENKDIICNENFYKVHYFFSMWQPT